MPKIRSRRRRSRSRSGKRSLDKHRWSRSARGGEKGAICDGGPKLVINVRASHRFPFPSSLSSHRKKKKRREGNKYIRNVFRATSGEPKTFNEEFERLFSVGFDPVGRDRNRSEGQTVEMHDVFSADYDDPSACIRLKPVQIRRLSNEPWDAVEGAKAYQKSDIESITDAICTSNRIISSLNLGLNFDFDKEAILWHGTRESLSDELVRSQPVTNPGAYGRGFYLTPHIGKADQYAIADGLQGTLCLIAYRVLLDGIIYNPGQNAHIKYIQKNRQGWPLRYHEVVIANTKLVKPIVVITYERYKKCIEETLPNTATHTHNNNGLRKRSPHKPST